MTPGAGRFPRNYGFFLAVRFLLDSGPMKSVVVCLSLLGLLLGVIPCPSANAAPSDQGTCRKLPAGKRVVKLSLKPDTEIGDLLAWISSITCKQFVLPGSIDARSKKVTIIAPQLITADEAYRLFLDAMERWD